MSVRSRRLLACGVLAGTVAWAATLPAATQAASPATPPGCGQMLPVTSVIGIQQRERLQLGFRCDANYIASLSHASHTFGLPLTTDEANEMVVRQSMARVMGHSAFAAFASSLPGFAGDYIDNTSGQAVYRFTSDTGARQVELAARFPIPSRLSVRTASFSVGALAALQRRLDADTAVLASRGVNTTSISTDIAANHVVVTVTNLTAAARSILAGYAGPDELTVRQGAGLRDFTAPGVCVLPPPTSTRCGVTDAPTFKGGQEIDNVFNPSQINPSVEICSSGFSVGRFAFPAGTTPFMLTAGHCDTGQAQWSQQAAFMGTVQANTDPNGVDGMIISLPAASASNQVFFAYFGGPTGAYHSVTAAEGQNADTIGEWICHAGITSGEACGTLQTKTLTATVNGVTFHNLREAQVGSQPGDSGGSVYAISCVVPPSTGCSNNVTAAGVLKGQDTSNGDMVYTHIYDEETSLSVSVLTS